MSAASQACIGIFDGDSPFLSGWGVSFARDPIIALPAALELIVDGFEPARDEELPVSKMVKIELRRADGVVLYRCTVNNVHLSGMPKLVWVEP